MNRILAAVVALALSCAPALAEYVIRDGNGILQTVKSLTCCGGTIQPQTTWVDISNNPIGTLANPINVAGSFSATTSATAAAALPTLSAGANAIYQSLSGAQYVQPVFGTQIVDVSHGLPVAVVGTVPVSGTFFQATQPVSIAAPVTVAQPTGTNLHVVCDSGCSSSSSPSFGAAFPATGTAIGLSNGTNMVAALADVSGNLKVAQQGTVTVSGTVTANAGTNLNTSLLALESGGNLANVYATLGTVAASPTANTIQDRLKVINATLGSPLQAGGTVVLGASSAVVGHVLTDAGSTMSVTGTVTVAGSVTANAGTNLNTSLLALESGGNLALVVSEIGGVTASPTANTLQDRLKTINTTLGSPFQAGGSIGNTTFASTQSGAWNITNISGTVSLPTGAATGVAQASTTSGQVGTLAQGAVTTAAPSYTTAQTSPLSLDTGGLLRTRVDNTVTVAGAVTNAGTFAVQLTGSTNNINNVSGTISLPTGAATAAKQPALGTAGTASADVLTVQGVASMTALKVDGSAVTQPVSGSVTANIGTVGTLATAANQTNVQAPVTNGAATATASLMIGCQYDSSPPTWTNGQQGHISCGPNGGLSVGGTLASGTADSGNPVKVGGVYNSTPATLSTGNRGDAQLDAKGNLRTVNMDAAGNARGANVNASNQLSVSVDNTPTVSVAAATTGGCTPYHLANGTTASTNSNSIKASAAGTLCDITPINTTATIYYLKIYDSAGAPTCSSATGLKHVYPIPSSASSNGAGIQRSIPMGEAYTSGIGYCVTASGTDTANDNAATGVYIEASYK